MTRTTGATDAHAAAELEKAILDAVSSVVRLGLEKVTGIPSGCVPVRVDDLRAIAELLAYDEYNVDMTSQEERDRYWRIVALIGEAE